MVPDLPPPNDERLCPNCSAALNGPYCSSCGQRQVDLDQPFRDLAAEAMESFLSFDARILRTLGPLVTSPGWLTVEFLAGRRVRYVHPFKLYFAFLALPAGLVIDLALRALGGEGPGNGVSVLVIAVYSFLGLRRVYSEGRLLTLAKMAAPLIGYLVALIATMILTLALTVVTV